MVSMYPQFMATNGFGGNCLTFGPWIRPETNLDAKKNEKN